MAESYKPHHQRATTLPDTGTVKAAPGPSPRRPATIENSPRDECTISVSDKDCTLEFSNRPCNLELNPYIDDKHIDKQIESVHPETGGEIVGTRDIESEFESVTGTVRRKSHRRRLILAGSVFGVVLLVVIIVPSAVLGTRHAQAQSTLPA